jgi:hypothetical protein
VRLTVCVAASQRVCVCVCACCSYALGAYRACCCAHVDVHRSTSATCPVDGYQSASYLCASATGVCDVDDYCTGTGTACPNNFKPSSTVCRASGERALLVRVVCRAHSARTAGVCDLAENCTGTYAQCPSDLKEPSSFVCHTSRTWRARACVCVRAYCRLTQYAHRGRV